MSLRLHDGEIIEIPDYIIRIINKAQQIVVGDNSCGEHSPVLKLTNGDTLPNDESEPVVVGKDGCKQTVSDYILSIIRSAQKVIQDEPLDDDIKDYDEFIDSTFDSMLNEADSDFNDEPSAVAQNVVDKLIDEVCNTKFKMPVLENSLISVQEEGESTTGDRQTFEEQGDTNQTEENKAEMETLVKNGTEHITKAEDAVHDKVDEIKENITNSLELSEKISEKGLETLNDAEDAVENVNKNTENECKETTDSGSKLVPSQSELENIAEKFVENICNDAKNELLIESQNVNNEKTDSSNGTEPCQENGTEISDKTDTDMDVANGLAEKTQENEAADKEGQNNTSKVHPEETKLTVAKVDDITQSESLPVEGKHGKEQKNDVSKDKIKPKRRSRGLRNSFRRVFSCFSTKSSQLE